MGEATNSSKNPSYADRDFRISKKNLYMVIARHMEEFPVERLDIGDFGRVGAVLVLPNDMIYAVDSSRNGVHGVARLLMAHQDTLKDCQVFVSRKPCSLCTKLLVQSKVKRVFYLPTKPEYDYLRHRKGKRAADFNNETSRVDELFKVSSIGQSVFVPRAEQDVIGVAESKKQTPEKAREAKKNDLMNKYWNENGLKSLKGNFHGLPSIKT